MNSGMTVGRCVPLQAMCLRLLTVWQAHAISSHMVQPVERGWKERKGKERNLKKYQGHKTRETMKKDKQRIQNYT